MKNYKFKILLFLVTGALLASGCGKKDNQNAESGTEVVTEESQVAETTESESETETETPTETETESQLEETEAEEIEKEEPESQVSSETVQQGASKPEYTFSEVRGKSLFAQFDAELRNAPHAGGNVVGKVTRAERLTVIEQCNETGWYKMYWSPDNENVLTVYICEEAVGPIVYNEKYPIPPEGFEDVLVHMVTTGETPNYQYPDVNAEIWETDAQYSREVFNAYNPQTGWYRGVYTKGGDTHYTFYMHEDSLMTVPQYESMIAAETERLKTQSNGQPCMIADGSVGTVTLLEEQKNHLDSIARDCFNNKYTDKQAKDLLGDYLESQFGREFNIEINNQLDLYSPRNYDMVLVAEQKCRWDAELYFDEESDLYCYVARGTNWNTIYDGLVDYPAPYCNYYVITISK